MGESRVYVRVASECMENVGRHLNLNIKRARVLGVEGETQFRRTFIYFIFLNKKKRAPKTAIPFGYFLISPHSINFKFRRS